MPHDSNTERHFEMARAGDVTHPSHGGATNAALSAALIVAIAAVVLVALFAPAWLGSPVVWIGVLLMSAAAGWSVTAFARQIAVRRAAASAQDWRNALAERQTKQIEEARARGDFDRFRAKSDEPE